MRMPVGKRERKKGAQKVHSPVVFQNGVKKEK